FSWTGAAVAGSWVTGVAGTWHLNLLSALKSHVLVFGRHDHEFLPFRVAVFASLGDSIILNFMSDSECGRRQSCKSPAQPLALPLLCGCCGAADQKGEKT